MYRKPLLVIGAAIIASGVLLNAQAPNQPPAPATPRAAAKANPAIAADRAFITEVWTDGMAEVELGKLASEKAGDDKVKMFGQRMVMDHGKAGDELTTLAVSKQVTLPASVDAKHKAMQRSAGDALGRAVRRRLCSRDGGRP